MDLNQIQVTNKTRKIFNTALSANDYWLCKKACQKSLWSLGMMTNTHSGMPRCLKYLQTTVMINNFRFCSSIVAEIIVKDCKDSYLIFFIWWSHQTDDQSNNSSEPKWKGRKVHVMHLQQSKCHENAFYVQSQEQNLRKNNLKNTYLLGYSFLENSEILR